VIYRDLTIVKNKNGKNGKPNIEQHEKINRKFKMETQRDCEHRLLFILKFITPHFTTTPGSLQLCSKIVAYILIFSKYLANL